ncbi:hypothetical protein IT411_03055 [Candidatus Peregrinibacteria bacterium]|nr:hypothetical protein [Candidatus Peregrinibacteria bacterium]
MKNLLKTIGISIILAISLILNFGVVFAADPPAGDSKGTVTVPPIIPNNQTGLLLPHDTSNDTNKNYLQNRLLPGIAGVIIGITGGVALVFVIFSGIQMLTSNGNPDAVGKAKKTLIYALVGILIATLSYGIVAIVASITVK